MPFKLSVKFGNDLCGRFWVILFTHADGRGENIILCMTTPSYQEQKAADVPQQ